MSNTMITNPKVVQHQEICKELNALYERKNHDYGDSFHQSFLEEGLAMARIRLGDKYSRFKTLSRKDSKQRVDDESIRDTLIDLANYAIMTVMEMDEHDITAGRKGGSGGALPKDSIGWNVPSSEANSMYVFGSISPQDATQGLSGDGGDSIGRYKKITPDDLIEAYRLALEEAKERTRSALDRAIAAWKENFGGFRG